jgi:hypothetical protein
LPAVFVIKIRIKVTKVTKKRPVQRQKILREGSTVITKQVIVKPVSNVRNE